MLNYAFRVRHRYQNHSIFSDIVHEAMIVKNCDSELEARRRLIHSFQCTGNHIQILNINSVPLPKRIS